jgi:hypothetical protein
VVFGGVQQYAERRKPQTLSFSTFMGKFIGFNKVYRKMFVIRTIDVYC